MKFHNLVEKGRWPRGPWNNEPDMVVFQLRRRGVVFTCVVKRERADGILNGFIFLPDDHPLAARNIPGMTATMARDSGFDIGNTYALVLRRPVRSISPAHFDPTYTYHTVDNIKEMLSTKVNEIDAAALAHDAANAAPPGTPAAVVLGGQEDEDIFLDDDDEEEYDDDDEEEDEEPLNALPNPYLTAPEIFNVSTQPQTPR